MASKRYALFMGSYTNLPNINYPINANTCNELLSDLKKSFNNAFGNGEYAFSWPNKASNNPEPEILKLTPKTGEVTTKIEELDGIIKDEDIFLFYYFGHGYIAKDNLCLAFEHYAPDKKPDIYSINIIVNKAIQCGAKKIILILDCCYGGHSKNYLETQGVDYYLLSASYNRYSKHNPDSGGIFTRELISILNDRNIEKYSQNHFNTITIKDLFGAVNKNLTNNLNGNKSIPTPYNKGNIGTLSLIPLTKQIFKQPAFYVRARFNTIYKKIFVLSEYLFEQTASLDEIYEWITIEKKHTSFKLTNSEFIDINTIKGYLDILIKLKFVKMTNSGKYSIAEWGVFATREIGLEFNKYLIRSLLNWMTSKELTWDNVAEYRMKIQNIFRDDLILKIVIPNYENFERVFFKKNELPMIDKKEVKTILQLYSFTEDLQRMDSNTYFL